MLALPGRVREHASPRARRRRAGAAASLCASVILVVTVAGRAAEPDGAFIVRVTGPEGADVESIVRDDVVVYRAGSSLVRTALPEGYPRPTPPGAMEIKYYPSVRRAEIRGGGGKDDGMFGMNTAAAFFPLFTHIKQRDIAMTAPVEMDYEGLERRGDGLVADSWSMSFLYREPDLGPTGSDGRIRVHDTEPVVVLALGVRGDLDDATMGRRLDDLEAWIEARSDWERAGSPRTFGYNGPDMPRDRRWHEIQIPIRPASGPAPPRDGSTTRADAGGGSGG